jgi:hypothetical protein
MWRGIVARRAWRHVSARAAATGHTEEGEKQAKKEKPDLALAEYAQRISQPTVSQELTVRAPGKHRRYALAVAAYDRALAHPPPQPPSNLPALAVAAELEQGAYAEAEPLVAQAVAEAGEAGVAAQRGCRDAIQLARHVIRDLIAAASEAGLHPADAAALRKKASAKKNAKKKLKIGATALRAGPASRGGARPANPQVRCVLSFPSLPP